MIFQFPDLDTVRVALTSGQIPVELAQASVSLSFDGMGRPAVEPAIEPPRKVQTILKRLGVTVVAGHHGEPVRLNTWLEILPVESDDRSAEVGPSTTVLFDLPTERFAELAKEMLRLGNDRQSFRHIQTGGLARVLLQVIGPPYYTLLGVVDRLHADVTAYVEKAPRIWVQLGFAHPLAAKLDVPPGRLLLLSPPRAWRALPEEPFHDIYEVLNFELPAASISFAEGKLEKKLAVPLRLAAGDAAVPAEMWVLKDQAVETFDAFVSDVDERIAARLIFAVTEGPEETPVVVLRMRPLLQLAPPSLELAGAVGFSRYRKLNNLFVPAGMRIQPGLRRDAVRNLLASDDDRIVWLMPQADGRFVPESLPDESFRPLQDWVEYIIDRDREALVSWVEATTFDFDSYICRDDLADRPGPGPAKPAPSKPTDEGENDQGRDPPADIQMELARSSGSAETDLAPLAVVPEKLKTQRLELEKEFLAIDGPVDDARRAPYWPQLASINTALDDQLEASICWSNALWGREHLDAEFVQAWQRSESKNEPLELTAAVLDRELARSAPSQAEFRRLVVLLLDACRRDPVPTIVRKRLPEIRRYLEIHDENIGVRAVWMIWRQLARVSSDVLGLARVRDRLLERMFAIGLSEQRDLPRFIRLADDNDGSRLRDVLDRSLRIREAARQWIAFDDAGITEVNRAYADLMFAFGFASLRELAQCRELLSSAQAVLCRVTDVAGEPDAAHQLLLAAYRYRIERALAGRPHRGSLPREWHDRFDELKASAAAPKKSNAKRVSIGPFAIERAREQFAILEPEERLNPYRAQTVSASALNAEITSMAAMHDPAPLSLRIKALLFDRKKSKYDAGTQIEIVTDLLPMCARIGPEFMQAALAQVTPLIRDNVDAAGLPAGKDALLPQKLAKLLERAFTLAVLYEVPEFVRQYAEHFDRLLEVKADEALFDVIKYGAAACIRSLRKCVKNDEIHRILIHIDNAIETRATRVEARGARGVVDLLAARLQVAGARFHLAKTGEALPAVDRARDFLFTNSPFKSASPWHQEYARLARAYIGALSHAEIPFALDRADELFRNISKVANTYTTATHYSRLHLNVIEEFVLGFMQPGSLLGDRARQWLDEDEYLIRRKIHAEMKVLLAQSGL